MIPQAGRGRPLRFLGLVIGGWVGMRVVLLWPVAVPVRDPAPRLAMREPVVKASVPPVMAVAPRPPMMPIRWVRRSDPVVAPRLESVRIATIPVPTADPVRLALLSPVEPEPSDVAPPLPLPPGSVRAGTTLSLWALARPGAATGGPVQLGGGQAGARVRVPIAGDDAVALVGRVATPLAGAGAEVAAGLEWRLPGRPVALVVERRVALDRGATGGVGIGAIAGIDRAQALAGFDLEAYAQAGVVLRKNERALYGDGAARLLHPVTQRVRIGVGGWGGAQRGAARLDIGPTAVVVVPVGGRAVRLSLDWRQRIAGNAAPESGPAVTLGGDF